MNTIPFAIHPESKRQLQTARASVAMRLLPVLLFLGLSAAVQAQFTFTTNNGAITITGYTGPGGAVTIPSSTNGLPVTSIGEWAFYATGVTNVVVPDSVTSIADGAFFDCAPLASITIGASVTNLGDWTFAFCSGLTSVCCRGNAPSLEGGNAFYGNLATVYYLPGATNWGPMFDGHPAVLWNPVVPFNYTTNNGTITITGYSGSGEAVIIPSSINFLPVTNIGDEAFASYSGLTNFTIPDSVTSIGVGAFDRCTGLTGVTIPTSVTSIGGGAFWGCSSLTGFTIPDSVTSIGDAVFAECSSLNTITIPNSVTSIGDEMFYYCASMTNVVVPNSVTNIGSSAFAGCAELASVTLPNSVRRIEGGAFYGCAGLTSITIPDRVTSIESSAFYGCASLTNVNIPSRLLKNSHFL